MHLKISLVVFSFLVATGAAFAQDRPAAQDKPAQDKPAQDRRAGDRGDGYESAPRVLEVSPEDSLRVRRYVGQETDIPVIEEHMTLRPGSIIPEGVQLRVFSRDTELARFAYFLSADDKIVIADPRTRVVVRIIDKKG